MQAIEYCRSKVLQTGSSFYYSTLALPQEQKDALTALYALCEEVQRIPLEIQEESVARIKLQWWTQEIQRMYLSDAQHPVTQALHPALKAYKLPQQLFEELIQGAELILDVDHCCNEKDFSLYCYRQTGIRTILAAHIGGFEHANTIKFAHHLGVSLTIINMLQQLRSAIQRGRVYFPLEDFSKFNIDSNELAAMKESSDLKQFLSHQAQKAKDYYQKALSLLTNSDKLKQRHNLIHGKLQLALLKEIEKDGMNVLQYQIQLTPLRKWWLARRPG